MTTRKPDRGRQKPPPNGLRCTSIKQDEVRS